MNRGGQNQERELEVFTDPYATNDTYQDPYAP